MPAHILLVEDDLDSARHLEAQLVSLGHQVIASTARGEEVPALVASERPHLVLMGVRLGGSIDGIDAAGLLGDQGHIPVVFVSAHSDAGTLGRAARHASGYLVKPVATEQLHAAVELALHPKRSTPPSLPLHLLDVSNGLRERLQFALQGSTIGFWEHLLADENIENGILSSVNVWEPLGYPAVGSRTIADRIALWHPDDVARVLNASTAYLKGETPHYEVEVRVRQQDGTYRWILSRGTALRDEQGRAHRFLGVSIDITDRKQAEAALARSQERYRATFEHAPAGLVHVDPQHGLMHFNPAYCEITGYTAEELLALEPIHLAHPEDLEHALGHFLSLSRNEISTYSIEHRFIRKDGRTIWLSVTSSRVPTDDGTASYIISIVHDVSRRKQLEEELRQARALAEQANRAKDEFLANVSHEIRTPMNAILGMTELVLDTHLTQSQRQSLKTVKSATGNLLGIINDLLDFSKIEAGKLALDPADFHLRSALSDTMRALAVRAHRKGLELVCNVHADVPDALVGDSSRLRQIVINLVGNALKFTAQGEVVMQVEVASTSAERVALRFSVRDTGIGISAHKQAAIFRAFEQEDASTSRKYGGTGLGLTIAARLIGLMDGAIQVESEPGRGSTFTFTADFGRSSGLMDAPLVRPLPLLRGMRVLVVDDNAVNRRIVEEWLRVWQMEPTVVGDGIAAMDALWHGVASGRPYALVLLDFRMPDIDGLSLAAKIRERSELSGSRIVLLTSADRPGDVARLRELKIEAHLLKPVPQDELLETLHHVMGSANAAPVVDPAPVTASTPGAAGSPARPLRILIAEDDDFGAQLLRQLLTRRGHDVSSAASGFEALKRLEEGSYDLLLLDLHMPELDGFEVIRSIRQREQATGAHLPVVAVTARSRQQDRARCLAAGMDDFLTKPIIASDLWPVLERLDRRRALRQLLDAPVLLAACGEDAPLLTKLCDALIARLPVDLGSIDEAIRDNDAARLRQCAHKLSGVLANFSRSASDLASQVEDCAEGLRPQEAAPWAARLQALSGDLLLAVRGLTVDELRGEAPLPSA
ncbi:response regulator [Corallococcus sp. CA053C]|uniref:response regulator n=1 Tax=Corallococcus sp. CA053C TaxID=2316732 RepID=UPI0013157937|nr:response regulator [Corallococcus sp. CA053C]